MTTQTVTIPNLEKFSEEEIAYLLAPSLDPAEEIEQIKDITIPHLKHMLQLMRLRWDVVRGQANK